MDENGPKKKIKILKESEHEKHVCGECEERNVLEYTIDSITVLKCNNCNESFLIVGDHVELEENSEQLCSKTEEDNFERIKELGESQPDVMSMLFLFLSLDQNWVLDVLEQYDIRGLHIRKLWLASWQDFNLFIRTVEMFRERLFLESEIVENLQLDDPIPFINYLTETDMFYAQEPYFQQNYNDWEEWCYNNIYIFNQKVEAEKLLVLLSYKDGIDYRRAKTLNLNLN